MTKVGILSMYRYPNYGAVLQCWALKNVCQQLGYDSQIINYYPWGEQKFRLNKTWPHKIIRRYFDLKSFTNFINTYGNLTKFVASHDEMMKNPPYEDIYISGADQIWNPEIVEEYLSSYLLDFVPQCSNRISYASSLGGVTNTESEKVFKNELPKYSSISVREPGFVNELKKISGKEVVDVCDPALLLSKDEYRKIEKKKFFLPKRYIAVMKLKTDTLFDDAAIKLSKKTGLPLVGIFGDFRNGYDKTFLSLSPQQWLYVMRNADYVVTNSFHGAVFSIVFRTPFVSVSSMWKAGNERITNLLQQTGLMKQYVNSIEAVDNIFSVDYDACEDQINTYKNRSLNWLKIALEKAANDKN